MEPEENFQNLQKVTDFINFILVHLVPHQSLVHVGFGEVGIKKLFVLGVILKLPENKRKILFSVHGFEN